MPRQTREDAQREVLTAERLTDADLDETLALARNADETISSEWGDGFQDSVETPVSSLVAEIRRLRSLITRAAPTVVPPSDSWCGTCRRTLISQGHAEGCSIGALEMEAEAINEEARAQREER